MNIDEHQAAASPSPAFQVDGHLVHDPLEHGEDRQLRAKRLICMGTQLTLRSIISKRSMIDEEALKTWKPTEFCASQIMEWASRRDATREEDRAYSLMGLFGVNMPVLYGEGDKAFLRLQEHIMKQSTDHTLLAHAWRTCLASRPWDFRDAEPIPYSEYAAIAQLDHTDFSCSITPQGIKFWAHMIERSTKAYPGDSSHLAVLRCSPHGRPDELYALPLHHSWLNEYHKLAIGHPNDLPTIGVAELGDCTWEEICITDVPESAYKSDWFRLELLDDTSLT